MIDSTLSTTFIGAL